jgi:hypothetical protein
MLRKKSLLQKIIEKLDSTFDDNKLNFPKEIVDIIASYSIFTSYGQSDLESLRDLEKFEEARYCVNSGFHTTITYGYCRIPSLQYWKNENKLPIPIFHSIFTPLEIESKLLGPEEGERYRKVCQELLDTSIFDNFLIKDLDDLNNLGDFRIQLFKKTNISKSNSYESWPVQFQAWELFKSFDISPVSTCSTYSTSFTWANLYSFINDIQLDDRFKTKSISSIDFDYKKSQFILIVKLENPLDQSVSGEVYF